MSKLPVAPRFGPMDKPRLCELDPVPSREIVQLVPLGPWRGCLAMKCFSLAHAGLPHRECVKVMRTVLMKDTPNRIIWKEGLIRLGP